MQKSYGRVRVFYRFWLFLKDWLKYKNILKIDFRDWPIFQKQPKSIKNPYSTLRFLKFETLKILFLGWKPSKKVILQKMIILERKTIQIKFFSKKSSVRKIKFQISFYLGKAIKVTIFLSNIFRILTLKSEFDFPP